MAFGRETRLVVWKDHDQVKSWWTVRPTVQTHRDIGHAIGAATGVSGGSAYTIPSALMKEAAWKGRNWFFLSVLIKIPPCHLSGRWRRLPTPLDSTNPFLRPVFLVVTDSTLRARYKCLVMKPRWRVRKIYSRRISVTYRLTRGRSERQCACR